MTEFLDIFLAHQEESRPYFEHYCCQRNHLSVFKGWYGEFSSSMLSQCQIKGPKKDGPYTTEMHQRDWKYKTKQFGSCIALEYLKIMETSYKIDLLSEELFDQPWNWTSANYLTLVNRCWSKKSCITLEGWRGLNVGEHSSVMPLLFRDLLCHF